MEKYDYEAFVSYSREDSEWANRLFASLENPNFRIFRDTERLRPGEKWNDQLADAIKRSRCLIVLWSSNAMASQWVWEEIKSFKHEDTNPPIYVLLNNDQKIDPEVQVIADIKTKNSYEAGAAAFPEDDWNKLVNKIRKAIYHKKGSQPIKRVVFTLNREIIDQTQKIPKIILDKVSVNYAERFADWKPFGMKDSIETILDNLLYADVNTKISAGGLAFHWEDIDWKERNSALWLPDMDGTQFLDDNVNATAAEIEKLKTDLCVVVLDPLALADLTIRERFIMSYDKCSENNDSLIMALHPYDITQELNFMRQQLRVARRFYDSYFDPPMLAGLKSADCFATTLDNLEIKRNLRFSLRKHVNRSSEKEKTASTILSINQ